MTWRGDSKWNDVGTVNSKWRANSKWRGDSKWHAKFFSWHSYFSYLFLSFHLSLDFSRYHFDDCFSAAYLAFSVTSNFLIWYATFYRAFSQVLSFLQVVSFISCRCQVLLFHSSVSVILCGAVSSAWRVCTRRMDGGAVEHLVDIDNRSRRGLVLGCIEPLGSLTVFFGISRSFFGTCHSRYGVLVRVEV